jgi:threonine dehydrogenase-like Zn-dependent dehydrogenase
VALEGIASCGLCRWCRAGTYNYCTRLGIVGMTIPGGFADFVSLPARHCFPVTEGIDFPIAALSEPLGVAVHGVRLGGLELGQRVLVLGAGTIGLAAARRPSALDAIFGRRHRRLDDVAATEAALRTVRLPANLAVLAGTLTFAEQKRLEVARALMGAPELVLLDEPAAGLNRAEIEVLIELVGAIRDRGVTVVLIEHNMKVVMGLCDRISVLDFGRKIAEGTADEVRRDPLVVTAYLGRSAGAGV